VRLDPDAPRGLGRERRRSATDAAFIISLFLIPFVAACGPSPERRPLAPTLPPVSGTLIVPGVSAPVRIVRDRWGVPHIKAENQDDLFFAQGFVQAQDRLFQMDLWRRSVQGRLSEVLGANFVERDAMTRRIQYRGDLEAEWASYGADTKAIVTAFVRGINAWIRLAHDPFPEEFTLAGWVPEWWRPEDLLNRTDAFVASRDGQDEVFHARLVAAVGLARARALSPRGALLELPRGLDITAVSPIVGSILKQVGTPPFFIGLAAPLPEDHARESRDLIHPGVDTSTVRWNADRPTVRGRRRQRDAMFTGSNAWAIARSSAGPPLVAGDPHRPLENPGLRYLVHLEAPGWNVIGATAPWLPGVAIGHNEHVAWSMTAAAADTQDIYVETLNPSNPRQVRDGGRWVDMVVEKDTIAVKGHAEPLEYEYSYTPHGVVIALDRQHELAYTVKWSGFEPGGAAELGALAINRSQSAAGFRDALRHWRMPSAEFVFADRDGHIGRQVAALVPNRSGWSGALPVPGHERRYEWRGWTALDRRSVELDPAASYVVSANRSPARVNRIVERLSDLSARSVEGFKQLQHDVLAWNAGQLVPLLARLRAEDGAVDELRQALLRWDRRMTAGSPETAAYIRWEAALARKLASRRIPASLLDEYVDRAAALLVPSLVTPSQVWFDAPVTRHRDVLLLESLAEAQDVSRDGASQRTVTFEHPLAVTGPTRRRFNIGPFPTPGYGETVFATAIPRSGRSMGPSARVILDTGDWDRSAATNPPGQSGWPASPHFNDLAKLWAAGEYFPLSFSDRAVQEHAQSTLILRRP
jgi:penicillin amidase